jgi:hypothetical protein
MADAMRILRLILCLLLACAPALALENENLLVRIPQGYKQGFSTQKNNMLLSEFVPESQTVENWTEMVTVQIFRGMKGVTPDQFRARMQALWSDACQGSSAQPIASAQENGYPVALWLMVCPRNKETGKPEWTWFKAMQGNDSFYLVQKAFKFAPAKEQNVEWTGWLKSVVVCDTRLPERACPAGMR